MLRADDSIASGRCVILKVIDVWCGRGIIPGYGQVDVPLRGILWGWQCHLAVKLGSRKGLLPRPLHANTGCLRVIVGVNFIGVDIARLNPIRAVLVLLTINLVIEPAIIRMTVVVHRTRDTRREHVHGREFETLWTMRAMDEGS